MADRNTIRRLVRELALKRADLERIKESLTTTKETVYESTLQDLAQRLGITTPPQVSGQVRLALAIESGNHARSIVQTFNTDLAYYAFQFGRQLDEEELRRTLRAWAENREASRNPIIAITETAGPYADALMAGFMEAGLGDALFDFGGRPEAGDEPPKCAICAALVETSPHPLKRVIRIGNPHPGCRQNWHPRDLAKLIEQLASRDVQLGARPAGIVGRPSLIHRAGNRAAAVRAIRSGRLPR
ncbi:MAG TPA: hypothetical protein VGK41_05470 [Solirubrobacterales bacterium]